MAAIGRTATWWGVVLLLLVARPGQASDALSFFKNYFVTGDYVAGGVGLRGTGVDGFATGTLVMTGVPADVDILAAFLYWQTVEGPFRGSGAAGATFRGFDVGAIARELNPAGTPGCWNFGGGERALPELAMRVYRADVLRFLPIGSGGKHVVNHADLLADGLAPHVVRLADAGPGKKAPVTAGATLVVVYRDPSSPYRAIVLYDGGFTLDSRSGPFSQTIAGFYQASTSAPVSRMTHVVADGSPALADRVRFNGGVIATNPFVGALGPAAAPAWDTVAFDALPLPAGAGSASVVVDHPAAGLPDCLSWGALFFSTTVQDTDRDGLLDVWESAAETLFDPLGHPLPRLRDMGADPLVQDIFVEIGYMETEGYFFPQSVQGPVPAHSHLPFLGALERVAFMFRTAPPRPGISGPINIHFDAGANYQPPAINPVTGMPYPPLPSLAECAAAWTPSCAIVPASLARGGESIVEEVCVETPTQSCAFPYDPGTVGWKSAYRYYRDQPLNFDNEPDCLAAGAACRRRFDRGRKDIFHYVLFAHGLGLARGDTDDPATPFDERKTPKNVSGIADPPGGDMLVTLGFWDDFVGTEFMQASTLAHELGHNLLLKHGGRPFEPNCKPNYQSIMNYLFQVRGPVSPAGDSVVSYSRQQLPALDELGLLEGAGLGPTFFRPRYYAPLASSFIELALGSTPATRHCDGSRLTPEEISAGVQMVRVEGTTVAPPIDWNADGAVDGSPIAQDISFDGLIAPHAIGTNDYARMDLRQVGGRRNVGSPRIGGAMSLDVGFGDVGFGDVGFGDVGFGDVGFGDVGYGDVGFGDVGFGDLGIGDAGAGDLGFSPPGVPAGEIDFDTATSIAAGPDTLKAQFLAGRVQLRWQRPHVGNVNTYEVYRVVGATVTPANFAARVLVGTTTAPTTNLDDTTVAGGVTYTYLVVAQFVDGSRSGPSNFATVTTP